MSTYTKEDIFQRIREVLVDQFELDAESITLDATLREDLDIDSIDAVDLMIELKSFTVQKMSLEHFQQVKTIGDIVDVVHAVVEQENASEQAES